VDEARLKLKEEIMRAQNGRPFAIWREKLLAIDPALLRHMHEFLMATEGNGAISESLRHLIYFTADVMVTHLFTGGAEVHAVEALRNGATRRQLLDAVGIAVAVNCRGYGAGLEIVLDAVAEAAGGHQLDAPLTSGQQAAKSAMEQRLGFWSDWMDDALRIDPAYLGLLIEFGQSTGDEAGLDAKSRELIFFAACGCPAMVDAEGMRHHARRALALGATQADLLQALRIANGIGLHGISEGIKAIEAPLIQFGQA
jgi:alkylhydroperoxidase/carboxymuconolactone decarboxylase family protein YurZ